MNRISALALTCLLSACGPRYTWSCYSCVPPERRPDEPSCLELSHDEINFGTVLTTSDPALTTVVVTLSNPCEGMLELLNVTWTDEAEEWGRSADGFGVAKLTEVLLDSGEEATIEVSFDPPKDGFAANELEISSNSQDGPEFLLVRGNGTYWP